MAFCLICDNTLSRFSSCLATTIFSSLFSLRRAVFSSLVAVHNGIHAFRPVEDMIVFEPLTTKKTRKDPAEIGVVWLIGEAKGAYVVEERSELERKTFA